ncbi:uncharacterized protein [Triticum aestivum]|uniref:uncharacterized protein n=1 Tax=Triticum aestivum TaxID=4565 RepID=UPI001D0170BF|nr:uncharacterized protein LOC123134068 [Triticum aestivum]
MNWCKFIVDFLHDAFSNKMYQKGCRLHLMARAPVEHLVEKFASDMTSLLGKLVEGWTTLNGSDSDAVARHFTSFIGKQTHRPTFCRGWYDYNSSEELPNTQDELDGDGFGGIDAGLDKDGNDDMENVPHDSDHDEHHEDHVGGKQDKAAPKVPLPEGGIDLNAARDTGVSLSKRGRAPEDDVQGNVGERCRADPVAARRSEATAGG